VGSGSFDVKGVKIAGKTLAGATGLNLGEAHKGGFTEGRKEQVEKRKKIAQELQVGENEPMKQALNKTEVDLQGVLGQEAREIALLDKTLEKFRQEVSDANNKLNAAKNKYESLKNTPAGAAAKLALDNAQAGADKANDDLDKAKTNKTNFRTGVAFIDSTGTTRTASGNIDALEKLQKTQTQAIKTENVRRNRRYATAIQSDMERVKGFFLSGGTYTPEASREAAHKIIMETKLESGTKT
jgi:hypothetical protein